MLVFQDVERGASERGTCAECGAAFIRRTKHKRLFCDIGCQEKAKRRRYRAKPAVKARIAKYMREWNRRRVSHDGV